MKLRATRNVTLPVCSGLWFSVQRGNGAALTSSCAAEVSSAEIAAREHVQLKLNCAGQHLKCWVQCDFLQHHIGQHVLCEAAVWLVAAAVCMLWRSKKNRPLQLLCSIIGLESEADAYANALLSSSSTSPVLSRLCPLDHKITFWPVSGSTRTVTHVISRVWGGC